MPLVISVTLASFNRRDTTLHCLRSLFSQLGVGTDFNLQVYLLDDSSPDGTAAEVSQRFPTVRIITGTGNLFWGGGMARAMDCALSQPHDFILMLNDDVELARDAIQRSMREYIAACAIDDNPAKVIVGAVTDPSTGTVTYFGLKRVHRVHAGKLLCVTPSSAKLTPCDTMNGNFVLIPAILTEKVRAVDPIFIHQLGDIDYGYRLKRAGGDLFVARKPVGTCAPNLSPLPYKDRAKNFRENFRALNSPFGLPIKPWVVFMWRWGGILGILYLILIYTKAIIYITMISDFKMSDGRGST